MDSVGSNPFKLDLNLKGLATSTYQPNGAASQAGGLLITCTDEKGPGLLLESLLSALDKLVERSFQTNLQLVAVIETLLSYPQPVITSYLIFVDAIKSNAICRITNVLKNLQSRIDAYAASTEGFEEMLSRGIRHKISRAERFERAERLNDSGRRSLSDRNSSSSARANFRFTHKAMETTDRLVDSSRNKNFAYAAIVLSQLCQIFAAYALQQNAAVEYGRGG